jgi:hypothetical protein
MMMTIMRTVIDNDDEDYFVNDYVCRLWYFEMTVMITKIIGIITMIRMKIKEITMRMFMMLSMV